MSRWQQELEKVRKAHGGRLHPEHVVQAARNSSSPLHDKFEWDDSKAGEQYRLQQAQALIRDVTFLPKGADEPIRAYVSLSSDRPSSGGYRATVDVLSNDELRAQLIDDATRELASFSNKYNGIRAAAGFKQLFKQIDKLVEKRK